MTYSKEAELANCADDNTTYVGGNEFKKSKVIQQFYQKNVKLA